MRDVTLTRLTAPRKEAPPGLTATGFKCYYRTAIPPKGQVNVSLLPHPPLLNEQCPFTAALVCNCIEGRGGEFPELNATNKLT